MEYSGQNMLTTAQCLLLTYILALDQVLEITTRQNIHLHWVRKKNVVDTISEIAKSGFFTINGCGDNTRNVIGCPLSYYSNKWAQKVGKYFALPTAAYIEVFEINPNYLRKAGLQDRKAGVTRFDYGPKSA